MHYFAERDVVDVAVHETRAWLRAQRLAIQTLDRFLVTYPALSQIEIRGKAGSVRQQVFDRDCISPSLFHLGDKFHDGIVESHFALLDQNHNAGRGGDDFSETGEIKNGIRCHRLSLGFDGARAVSLAPDDSTMTTDKHHRSRQFFLIDRLPDD